MSLASKLCSIIYYIQSDDFHLMIYNSIINSIMQKIELIGYTNQRSKCSR